MIVMAKKLGLEVIAEGVEGPQQEELLLQAGCSLGQGYLYSRPVPVHELDIWLRERSLNPNPNNSSSAPMMTGLLPTRE